jgi:hypothetical protein
MVGLLIASSPVEIEAKAEEAAWPDPARETALALFHELTDRLGHAARSLHGAADSWPKHRFYFGENEDPEIASLIQGLQDRPDFIEVTTGVSPGAEPTGLFVRDSRAGFSGVLVGHESHEGLPYSMAPHPE